MKFNFETADSKNIKGIKTGDVFVFERDGKKEEGWECVGAFFDRGEYKEFYFKKGEERITVPAEKVTRIESSEISTIDLPNEGVIKTEKKIDRFGGEESIEEIIEKVKDKAVIGSDGKECNKDILIEDIENFYQYVLKVIIIGCKEEQKGLPLNLRILGDPEARKKRSYITRSEGLRDAVINLLIKNDKEING